MKAWSDLDVDTRRNVARLALGVACPHCHRGPCAPCPGARPHEARLRTAGFPVAERGMGQLPRERVQDIARAGHETRRRRGAHPGSAAPVST